MNDVNEGLDYAQMLEIPVSTVNVVKKRSFFARKKKDEDLKERAIGSVNERLSEASAVQSEPDYSGDSLNGVNYGNFVQAENLSESAYAPKKRDRGSVIIMGEAIAACLIAAGIFISNIFISDTVINTFVKNLTTTSSTEAAYTDFTLTSPVGSFSEADVEATSEGVIYFTQKTYVYPVCEGEISSISQSDGEYAVTIAHTSTFYSVVTGLDTVYASVGESVKGNLPFAYSDGEGEVKIFMYSGEQLLNCYALSGTVPVWTV